MRFSLFIVLTLTCVNILKIEAAPADRVLTSRTEVWVLPGQTWIPSNYLQFRPWQVAIYTLLGDEYIFRCGGSLISGDAVLTAAHCVTNPNSSPTDIKVVAGEQNRSNLDDGEQTRSVSAIAVHPNYTGTLSSVFVNDIALLKIAEEVTTSEHVVILEPAADDSAMSSESECLITGWGITDKKSKSHAPSTLLSAAMVTLVSNEECNKRSIWDGLIKPVQMCAFNKDVSACLGNSGGPLVCRKNDNYIQYGITSWGTRSCDQKPSVFTRISSFYTWINTTLTTFKTTLS